MNLRDWLPFMSNGDEETAPVEPATGLSPIPTNAVDAVAKQWPADFSHDDLEYTLNAVQDYAIEAYGPTAHPGTDNYAEDELIGHPIAELVHHPDRRSDLEKLFHADDDDGVEGYIVNGERWDVIREDLDMSQLALDAVKEAHRLYAINLGHEDYGALLNPLFISTDNPPALEGEVADVPGADAPAADDMADGRAGDRDDQDQGQEQEQSLGGEAKTDDGAAPPSQPAESATTADESADGSDDRTTENTPDLQAGTDSTAPTTAADNSPEAGEPTDDSGGGESVDNHIDIEFAEIDSRSDSSSHSSGPAPTDSDSRDSARGPSPEPPSDSAEDTNTASTASSAGASPSPTDRQSDEADISAKGDTSSVTTESTAPTDADGAGEVDSTEESAFVFEAPSEASGEVTGGDGNGVQSVEELVEESSFAFETNANTAAEEETPESNAAPEQSNPSSPSGAMPTPSVSSNTSTPETSSSRDRSDGERIDPAEAEWDEWMLAAVEPRHSRREQ